MKDIIIRCFALCLPVCVLYGNESPLMSQELSPIESGYTYHTPEYQTKIRQVLLQKAGWLGRCEFQFLMLPPFDAEVLLVVSRKGTNYNAEVFRPEKMIWTYTGDLSDIKVIRVEKTIPKELAERATLLWAQMLIRASFQKSYIYPDATSYCFFKNIPQWGDLSGECVFRNGTRSAKLAGIGMLLVDYVQAVPADEKRIASITFKQMEEIESALTTNTSPTQEADVRAVKEVIRKQSEEAEEHRLWEEERTKDYLLSREEALKEMRKTAVRFGPSGYWDDKGTYRPFP